MQRESTLSTRGQEDRARRQKTARDGKRQRETAGERARVSTARTKVRAMRERDGRKREKQERKEREEKEKREAREKRERRERKEREEREKQRERTKESGRETARVRGGEGGTRRESAENRYHGRAVLFEHGL